MYFTESFATKLQETLTPDVYIQVNALDPTALAWCIRTGYDMLCRTSTDMQTQAILRGVREAQLDSVSAITHAIKNVSSDVHSASNDIQRTCNTVETTLSCRLSTLASDRSQLPIVSQLGKMEGVQDAIMRDIHSLQEKLSREPADHFASIQRAIDELPAKLAAKSASSVERGSNGEAYARTIFAPHYAIVDTHAKSKSGDFVIEHNSIRLLVEVKDYSRMIPKDEVEKFRRDVELSGVDGGLFISLSSSIPAVADFHLTTIMAKTRQLSTVYVASNNPQVLHVAAQMAFTDIHQRSQVSVNVKSVDMSRRDDLIVDVKNLSDALNSISKSRDSLRDLSSVVSKALMTVSNDLCVFEDQVHRLVARVRETLEHLTHDERIIHLTNPKPAQLLESFKAVKNKEDVEKVLALIQHSNWKVTKEKLSCDKITIEFQKLHSLFKVARGAIVNKVIHDIYDKYTNLVRLDAGELIIHIDSAHVHVIAEVIARM